jgi:hypothetical protein
VTTAPIDCGRWQGVAMKLASFAFFLLLLAIHVEGDFDVLLGRPLSMFRDGDQAWLGYLLFALLLLIGLCYARALAQSRREGEATVVGLAVLLLVVVAATPSLGAGHGLCSFLLLFLLFGYYALLLYRAGSLWLMPHLFVPVVLALATQLHSYGLWQKSIIAYFVMVALVHHHLLSPAPAAWRRGQLHKRRKVYQLDLGQEWGRRRQGTG